MIFCIQKLKDNKWDSRLRGNDGVCCERSLNNKSVIPAKAGIPFGVSCFALVALLLALSACSSIHSNGGNLSSRNGLSAGDDVTVKGNENIYTIAREHNVSMRDLIVLNNLKPPYEVHQGQTLTLPAGGTSFTGDSMKPPAPAPRDEVERSQLAPIEPAPVTSGQPLDVIAPAPATTPVPPPPNNAPVMLTPLAPSPTPSAQPPAAVPPPVKPNGKPVSSNELVPALNQPAPQQKQVATTMAPAASAGAASAATASAIDMKWPVQGPILSAYGSKGAGLNNDGVNIGAPKGAPVVAAAGGTVVYAGNEMKGFGNLVLIRHQGDWVTAYAQLDRVLVKKDSIVAQGDEIGTVGKTGNVASPQLHFETRHAGKAVDPASVIKSST